MLCKPILLLLCLASAINPPKRIIKHTKLESRISVDTSSLIVKRDTATWFDRARNRPVPVAIYSNQAATFNLPKGRKLKLVILNPGYPGKNTDYGYIAKSLAAQGYFVVTIQHNLISDPPIPTQGNLYQLRLPFWTTGVENILFVLNRLKKIEPRLDYKHLILIGHSNGGDITMLLAKQYPQLADIIISLDNRRVPFPRGRHPKIFSIRSSDQPADTGVLPTEKEQKRYHLTLVKVNTVHADMGGFGNPAQLSEINKYILEFLK